MQLGTKYDLPHSTRVVEGDIKSAIGHFHWIDWIKRRINVLWGGGRRLCSNCAEGQLFMLSVIRNDRGFTTFD